VPSQAGALTQPRVLQALRLQDGTPVSQAVTALVAEVRENVKLRRAYWCAAATRCGRAAPWLLC
jgi:translation elongation factor EF-Ts